MQAVEPQLRCDPIVIGTDMQHVTESMGRGDRKLRGVVQARIPEATGWNASQDCQQTHSSAAPNHTTAAEPEDCPRAVSLDLRSMRKKVRGPNIAVAMMETRGGGAHSRG